MIVQIAQQVCPKDFDQKFALVLFPEELWLNARVGELQRFCRLLLQDLIGNKENGNALGNARLTMRTGKTGEKIYLRILDVGNMLANSGWAGFDDTAEDDSRYGSLTRAACRSLARHIHGKIRTEKDAEGRCDIVIEF